MQKFLDNYLDKIIAVIIILVISYIINLAIDKIINKTIRIKRKKNITTLLLFIKRIKKIVIYAIAILTCLFEFDVF